MERCTKKGKCLMKLMWLCGSVPEDVCAQFSIPQKKPESWIQGIHSRLRNDDKLNIIYLLPERIAKKRIESAQSDIDGCVE